MIFKTICSIGNNKELVNYILDNKNLDLNKKTPSGDRAIDGLYFMNENVTKNTRY